MMKLKYGEVLEYPEDCIRLSKVALANGVSLSVREAQQLWEDYSEQEYQMGWFSMDDFSDESLWCVIAGMNDIDW